VANSVALEHNEFESALAAVRAAHRIVARGAAGTLSFRLTVFTLHRKAKADLQLLTHE